MIVTIFLHNLLRYTSARLSQIECHINTFDAILHKTAEHSLLSNSAKALPTI